MAGVLTGGGPDWVLKVLFSEGLPIGIVPRGLASALLASGHSLLGYTGGLIEGMYRPPGWTVERSCVVGSGISCCSSTPVNSTDDRRTAGCWGYSRASRPVFPGLDRRRMASLKSS